MGSKIKLWTEGYSATGHSGSASFCGEFEAETIKDAVIAYKKSLGSESETFINTETLTFWGLRFFDNEADARKSFG